MGLMAIVKFGYAIVIITFILMIWASLSGALEMHMNSVLHSPCLFQARCTCSKPAGDLGIVNCIGVPILRVPSTINSSKVFVLQLQGNRIRDLEPHFFQSTGLYRLSINQNPLETIPEEAFLGLDNSLWELELKQDGLTSVPSRALRYLQKLTLLDLTGNEITDITSDNWRGLENTLQRLVLADNSIYSLPPDSFSGLLALETLDLRGNHLAHIDSGVLRDMNRLTKLLLQDNQLAYIPYEELSPLKHLQILDLSSNVIKQIPPSHELNNVRLSLDILKLDNNIIEMLYPMSFKYFAVLNTTSLDGNPIDSVREDAFRQARIRSLSLRDCGLTDLSPAAFAGLENSLQSLDISENNLTLNTRAMFRQFDALRHLNLRENKVDSMMPTLEMYSAFQYKLFYLDISGAASYETSLQDIRRMRSLRYLSLGKLIRRTLTSDDFFEFGVELEELKIVGSTVSKIDESAFQHVRTIKSLDLSENNIEYIDTNAFGELHSLISLKLANGLADNVKVLPFEPLKALIELQYLDFSNNRLKNVPDTSFHFLSKLKKLELQDNIIDHFSKGTLQGDIHEQLETVILSFNRMKQIVQHTFVDLQELKQIYIEDNQLELIQKRAFRNLDNLSVIKLKGNRIHEITEEAFQNLPALAELDITYNRLDNFKFSMFDQVGSATSLKVNASYNYITVLTDSSAINYFAPRTQSMSTVSVNIRVLDFSHNNITYIAPYYFRHAALTISELYLSHNQLRNITREIFGSMPQLQYLDLSHNHIYDLEYDCFKKTKSLQMVLLSDNNILEIPVDVFHEMEHLTFVDLSGNDIRALNDNLFPASGLERLDLSNNELTRVPTNCISPAAASTLVELDLSGNSIPAVAIADLVQRYRNQESPSDPWLEEVDYTDEYVYHTARRDHTKVYHQKKQFPQNILYKSLVWLDLSKNRIVRIEGGSFSALPKLRWLDLSHNSPFTAERGPSLFKGLERKLTHLGLRNVSLQSVPSLPLSKLRSLDLSFNNLPSVPPETAANLTRLRKLDLSYNDLSTVPVATHSLNELRWLSLSGNPITSLTNTSLYGVSAKLEYLDITRMRLKILENGVISKMSALRTLKITAYDKVRDFNIPKLLRYNAALKNLYVEVDESGSNLGKEMSGQLPCKLQNITFTGRSLKYLSENVLRGVHSKVLLLTVYNSSITDIDQEVFWHPGRIRNISLDLRSNQLNRVPNPSTGEWPGVPNSLFLQDIYVSDNPLVCDCGIGWIEAWDRKRRQYSCDEDTSAACWSTRDDVRFARCVSYENRTLFNVMQNDLECGWSSSSFLTPKFYMVIGMFIATLLYI